VRLPLCASAALLLLALPARADEGMWLPNRPPRELLKKKYGFDLTDAWLERAMKASLRFSSGASGGFVSGDGLVVTNHHVGADAIQKLSTPQKNYYRDGFYARTREQELKCTDLELSVLQQIDDVTGQVQGAVKDGMTPEQAAAARKAVIARLEKEGSADGLRAEVVTLYHGGQYHRYRYKKYTDVRLVFAPEEAVAGFGGDVDNFEYPRYSLDVSFFRVYEDGKPARTPYHFKWSSAGPAEGDLVLVSGHPGVTNRQETWSHLRHRRDVTLPYLLARIRAEEALLTQYAMQGPEQARQALSELHAVANRRKVWAGQFNGLLDDRLMRGVEDAMTKLYNAMGVDDGKAIGRVEEALGRIRPIEKEHQLYEKADAFNSRLFRIARQLVRLADEKPKPNEERLKEYRDSALKSLELELFSAAPIYPELERAKLAGSLAFLAEQLGADHPLVKPALARKTPAARAAELIGGTKLADVAERKRLAEGGKKAVEASGDLLIRLARLVDGEARLRRKAVEEQEEVLKQNYAAIAQARFKLYGADIPPDATFTLRLALGVVKGYRADGRDVPHATTFAGLYERGEKQQYREPFALPKRWLDGKAKVDLKTPLNFAATSDTIGGNSGSPVLNRAGELVGINFDRNRHGLVRNFVYTEEQARHISVHSQGVLHALKNLYGADRLIRELSGN
jgi:hypothetical protein